MGTGLGLRIGRVLRMGVMGLGMALRMGTGLGLGMETGMVLRLEMRSWTALGLRNGTGLGLGMEMRLETGRI